MPSAPGGPGINWPTAALRWLLFAGLAAALGGAVAQRFTASARQENPALPPVQPWPVPGAGVAAVAAIGVAALLAAGSEPGALWEDRAGHLVLVDPKHLARRHFVYRD